MKAWLQIYYLPPSLRQRVVVLLNLVVLVVVVSGGRHLGYLLGRSLRGLPRRGLHITALLPQGDDVLRLIKRLATRLELLLSLVHGVPYLGVPQQLDGDGQLPQGHQDVQHGAVGGLRGKELSHMRQEPYWRTKTVFTIGIELDYATVFAEVG